MWRKIISKGILAIIAMGIMAIIASSYVNARADEDQPTIEKQELSLHDKLMNDMEEWNKQFEEKMKRPSRPVITTEPLDERHTILVKNIMKLSHVEKNRAIRIAKMIIEHSDFCKIPHENFVAAIIQRESNFAQRVEDGRRRGALGEIGLMQVMPRGYAIRRFGEECEQTSADCNIMTGTRYLQDVREYCKSEDPWVWMAAYGAGDCPSSKSARRYKSAKNARKIFCDITPDCDRLWPL